MASATSYYVSNAGTDAPGCTTPANACKTLAYVDSSITLYAGDSVLLQRGGVWNEQLVAAAGGTSGSPIKYDAYGTGPAPVITAAAPILPWTSGTGTPWTYVSGSTWKATIPSTIASPTVNMVQFGNLYGRKRPYGSGCASSITSKYDWCLSWPYLYVYSAAGTNPVTTYAGDGSIVPVMAQVAGLSMISIAGKNWLTFQHIKVQVFDYIGVGVGGTSDNLVFANMEVDGVVPFGATPLGFYVSATNPANIQFLNDDAHLNYDGFRFDGTATAITVTNCRAYANRDAGLKDSTGKATYSYSHFYGNNVAQFPSNDVVGGIAGSGNISSSIAPIAVNFKTYPALFSFTVDDVGSSPGTEGYINGLLTTFSSRPGIYFNAAVVPSYAVDWDSVNAWYSAGNEIDSHSWSHQYYTTNTNPQSLTPYPNAPGLVIQYTGSGTAATMTIASNILSTTVTGASGDSIPGINLASYTAQSLYTYLQSVANYSVQQNSPLWTTNSWPLTRPNTHAMNLANVSSQDIKTAPYALLYDQTKLEPDEMLSSKNTIQSSVAGLTESFYVYPDGIEDPTIEADAVAGGYTAARGSLAMKGQDNTTATANSLYSNGVNVQNLTSLAAVQIHGLTQAQINQMAANLVFRAAAWGAPYGFFTHYNSRGDNTPDISNTELGWLLDAVTANGGVWLTNMALANAVTSVPAVGFSGTTRYMQIPTGAAVNLAAGGANSPGVGRGAVTPYPVDLNGTNRLTLGTWDVGASAYLSQRYGTGGGTGSTYMGGSSQGAAQLPLNWVNSNEWAGTTSNTIAFPASGAGGSWSCGATNYGPYTAGSQSSLQQAVNDAETCRAANGSGTLITVPAGTTYSGANGLTLPQTAGDTSSNFIILQSSAPLPVGQTVCSHGIQDNVSSSYQPGIRNLGCNGSSMSYQLGTTVTAVSGAFTLANGTATNTSAYNDVASMWTVENTGTNKNAVATAMWDANNVGPHHFAILNAELRPQAGLAGTNAPLAIGQGNETLTSQIPTHIHLAYSYLHGDWTDAPVSGGVATAGPTGANSLPNDIALSGCISCSLSYNYIDRSIRPGAEGHGIALSLAQQIKIVHNWIEGQSIGHLCGGFAGAITISGFVTCQDMEDRGNRYTYPYSWLLAKQAGFNPNGGANGYVRKNAHEYKFGERVLVDGNIFENTDNSGAQNGTGFSFKTAQTSGGGMGTNYWTTLDNVTVTNNVGRNFCNGPSFGDRSDNTGSNGGGVSLPAQIFQVANNLVYNASTNNPGCAGSTPQYGWRIGSSVPGNTWAVTPLRDGAGLTTTLTLTATGGEGVSDMNVGDPVAVTGCSDASFNVGNSTMGPPALPGTQTNGLTVVYSNPGTPGAGAGVTGCVLSSAQGWPNSLSFTHNTFIDDPSSASNPSNSASGGTNIWPLARNFTLTNSVLINGGLNSTSGEGTRTEVRMFDPATEVFNNVLMPGRDGAVACPGHNAGAGGMAACYTEYSGAHAASTPTTLYGTATSYCSGNDPTTGSCAGILAAMNSSSFPITVSDWHQYRLCHAGDAACSSKASPYSAGQTYQASDGSDLGFAGSAIDAAQTRSIYVCGSGCGSSGPYPDYGSTAGYSLGGSPMFGFTETSTGNGATFPSVSYGMQRIWDSPPLQWPSLNTAAGVFTFTNLDTMLGTAYANGTTEVLYTLARTPPWISSGASDSTLCHYPTGAVGGGNGECYPPTDLNADGSGTNATWKAWITKIAQHANGQDFNPTYLTNHAHIRYWEIWNEPDAQFYWNGTFAQLARLTEDARCIIKGTGVIHQSGDGTATPCTATAIDPTAQIVMSSGHADSVKNRTYAQNQLYCNNTGNSTYTPSWQLPCPIPATATAAAIDVVNYHMKPGNTAGYSWEDALNLYVTNLHASLQTAELAKPLWDGEMSYAEAGFTNSYTDPDMASSLWARMYLSMWSQGISGSALYTWDSIGGTFSGASQTQVTTAYQQTFNWLTGAVLTSPCAESGTVWQCGIVKNGVPYGIIWDTSQSCSSGSCTTANQTVGSQWGHSQDMTTASTPAAIAGHSVAVGIKPVVLSQ